MLAVGLGAASAAIGLATMVDEPPDFSSFADRGSRLLHGDLSDVYRDRTNQSGLFQLLSGAVFRALVPHHLELPALRAVGALVLVLGAVVGLARLRTAVGLRPAPVLILALGGLLALWEIPGYGLDCHLAELAIPATWITVGLAMRRGRPYVAAVLLGLSAGWELWGLLGAPLLLHGRTKRSLSVQLGAASAATAAALYLPFALTGHFAMFEYVWPIDNDSLWHHVSPGRLTFVWWMRVAQGAAAVTVGAVAARWLRTSRHLMWLVPLAVFDTRLLLDPIAYDYYYVTAQLLAAAGVGLLDRESARDKVLIAGLAYTQFATTSATRLPLLAGSVALSIYLARALRPPTTASG
jgi:hypothetical protein